MGTLKDAVREGLQSFRRWRGAAIVQKGDGTYDAIPIAYLTDIGYGDRDDITEVLLKLTDPSQLGPDWDESVNDDIVDWLTEQIRNA